MPELRGPQFQNVLMAINGAYTKNTLRMAIEFGLTERLDDIAGGKNNVEIVFNLISWANSVGRTIELLEALRDRRPQNQDFCIAIGDALASMQPPPPGPPAPSPPVQLPVGSVEMDTMLTTALIGGQAFIDRHELRNKVKNFLIGNVSEDRVLIINGPPGCGKTYSEMFIDYALQSANNIKKIYIDLEDWGDSGPEALEFIKYLSSKLNFDCSIERNDYEAKPERRARKLRGWFLDEAAGANMKCCVVIDNANIVNLKEDTGHLLRGLIKEAAGRQVDGFQMVLLGYDELIDFQDNFYIVQENMEMLTPHEVKESALKHVQFLYDDNTPKGKLNDGARKIAEQATSGLTAPFDREDHFMLNKQFRSAVKKFINNSLNSGE